MWYGNTARSPLAWVQSSHLSNIQMKSSYLSLSLYRTCRSMLCVDCQAIRSLIPSLDGSPWGLSLEESLFYLLYPTQGGALLLLIVPINVLSHPCVIALWPFKNISIIIRPLSWIKQLLFSIILLPQFLCPVLCYWLGWDLAPNALSLPPPGYSFALASLLLCGHLHNTLENPKNSTKKPLEIIDLYYRVAGIKINTPKSMAFLYI